MHFCISQLKRLRLRWACTVMPLRMRCCLCACIVKNLNFLAPSINNYHICANARLKRSKPLAYVCLTIINAACYTFKRAFAHMWFLLGGAIFKTMHAQRQVRMNKGITAHARLKKKAYQPQNKKSRAPTGLLFLREKGHHTNLCFVENRFIPFSRRSTR